MCIDKLLSQSLFSYSNNSLNECHFELREKRIKNDEKRGQEGIELTASQGNLRTFFLLFRSHP